MEPPSKGVIHSPPSNFNAPQYSRVVDRLWRKNRRPGTGNCFGVDLNRNYPYKWGEVSKSSHTYCSTGDLALCLCSLAAPAILAVRLTSGLALSQSLKWRTL